MATVTGLTAERMLAIEGASVVDGDVVGDNLILTQHNGSQINAGNVRGPAGPIGPVGSDTPLLASVPILDVGLSGQIRAGRQLTATDFTNMGLNVPIGLWNLSDLTDVSGNGRNLLNKGGVPTTFGINGLANTAARFVGSSAQGLYISDTGANDPFRMKTGTWGCWSRTAKRATAQSLISKWVGQNLAWLLWINSAHQFNPYISHTGTDTVNATGITEVCDDRWHFLVATYDGLKLNAYVDGVLEGTAVGKGPIFPGSSVFNIGSGAADASTAAGSPHFGSIDEAFVTSDVLTEDQIRNLYCVRIPHTLGVTPSRITLNVDRRRKGGAFTLADFASQPLRLHNFSAGSLGDEGAQGITLVNNGLPTVAGLDGIKNNAFYCNGIHTLYSTDVGLPVGLSTRSYGLWLKTQSKVTNSVILAWGSGATTNLNLASGAITAWNSSAGMQGPFIADGLWHFIVITEENAPLDTVKRKMYVDGRVVQTDGALASITSGGADRFHIGSYVDGSMAFEGVIDSVFVTGYVMTAKEIGTLYSKGVQLLAPSPKNVGDHVEALSAVDILATFDSLASQHTVDLMVAP